MRESVSSRLVAVSPAGYLLLQWSSIRFALFLYRFRRPGSLFARSVSPVPLFLPSLFNCFCCLSNFQWSQANHHQAEKTPVGNIIICKTQWIKMRSLAVTVGRLLTLEFFGANNIKLENLRIPRTVKNALNK